MPCLNHPARTETVKVELCPECIIHARLCARASPGLLSDLRNGVAILAGLLNVLEDVQPDMKPTPSDPSVTHGKVFGVIAKGPEGKPFFAFAHNDPADPSVAIVGKQSDRIPLAQLISIHSSYDAARRQYYRRIRGAKNAPASHT